MKWQDVFVEADVNEGKERSHITGDCLLINKALMVLLHECVSCLKFKWTGMQESVSQVFISSWLKRLQPLLLRRPPSASPPAARGRLCTLQLINWKMKRGKNTQLLQENAIFQKHNLLRKHRTSEMTNTTSSRSQENASSAPLTPNHSGAQRPRIKERWPLSTLNTLQQCWTILRGGINS